MTSFRQIELEYAPRSSGPKTEVDPTKCSPARRTAKTIVVALRHIVFDPRSAICCTYVIVVMVHAS
jgi:hypothetical protein